MEKQTAKSVSPVETHVGVGQNRESLRKSFRDNHRKGNSFGHFSKFGEVLPNYRRLSIGEGRDKLKNGTNKAFVCLYK